LRDLFKNLAESFVLFLRGSKSLCRFKTDKKSPITKASLL